MCVSECVCVFVGIFGVRAGLIVTFCVLVCVFALLGQVVFEVLFLMVDCLGAANYSFFHVN